jgi:hypothetical protein
MGPQRSVGLANNRIRSAMPGGPETESGRARNLRTKLFRKNKRDSDLGGRSPRSPVRTIYLGPAFASIFWKPGGCLLQKRKKKGNLYQKRPLIHQLSLPTPMTSTEAINMEAKLPAADHAEEAPDEKIHGHPHGAVGALTTAHLYTGKQEKPISSKRQHRLSCKLDVFRLTERRYPEDSEGRVLARLLLPRPTNDPRDPLVRVVSWKPPYHHHSPRTESNVF